MRHLYVPMRDSLQKAWIYFESQLPSLDLSIFWEQEALFILAIPILTGFIKELAVSTLEKQVSLYNIYNIILYIYYNSSVIIHWRKGGGGLQPWLLGKFKLVIYPDRHSLLILNCSHTYWPCM